MNPIITLICFIGIVFIAAKIGYDIGHLNGKIEGIFSMMQKLKNQSDSLIADAASPERSHDAEYYKGALATIIKIIDEKIELYEREED